MKLKLPILLALIAGALGGSYASAIVTNSPRAEFFEKKIRPILMANCYKCHSPAAAQLKGGFNLASRAMLLKGGKNGLAVVLGAPEKSKLIEAVSWTNKDLQMPPKTQLPESAIADLTEWVRMGAPWSGGNLTGSVGPSWANYQKLRQTYWAWQPIRPVKVPAVRNTAWPLGPVDNFILAKLESQGLHPAGPANRYELLRRVTFDLTGLPPTLQEVEAFAVDESPDAYSKVVDRLLASPAFGERWGRHWLDVARYAESTGSARNYPYEYAWRYRDYVINSFNSDKPYNQFLVEQIAGDLLPYHSAKQHDDQLIATGFLALGVKDLGEKDRTKYLMDNVDEQIDVTGKAILGLTLGCARCHDHKFDPIPQSDYYKLAGIFRSTEILCGLKSRKGGGKKQAADDALLIRLDPLGQGAADAGAAQADQLQQLNHQLAAAQSQLQDERGGGKRAKLASGKKKKNKQLAGYRAEVQNLETEIAVLKSGSGLAIGVEDEPRPENSPLYEHGETSAPGPIEQRGVISLCNFVYAGPIAANQSGRLELARWLASPQNPLTTRVIANRIWHNLFGEGLVRTVDNFGTTGELPSHPELLDYLATRFVKDGWSFKTIIRELVMTRTYQMAGTYDAADAATDPSDRLMWRIAPRRLEAEEIRDAILTAAGDLDQTPPVGSPVMGMAPGELRKAKNGVSIVDAARDCRSVYLPILRDDLPISLERFDFADPDMVTGDREVTTVAPQALYLMNDPFVLGQSQKIAGRIMAHDWMNQGERIDLAYKLTYGRPATPAEKKMAEDYLNSFAAQQTPGAGSNAADAWGSFCQALLASAEFRYLN